MSELIDNRAHRLRTLKGIIKDLHAGQPSGTVKERLAQLVGETDYSEIVAMEQELMAEGMPVEEVQRMCDVHSQVVRESLVQLAPKPVSPGHPVDTFRRENAALREVIAEMRRTPARETYNQLMDVEKHYQRKEHAFFPFLERHEITGPSKVMWAKDDEVRRLLATLGQALASGSPAAAASAAEAALSAVEEMMYKEDHILLPMCLDRFTEDEWGEIWASSPRYGWCLVEPQVGYQPPEAAVRESLRLASTEAVQLPTGNLTIEQLIGIFATLPVDVTFVDADDRVAFFSEGPDRVFARSKAIIGRKVQHCHPPRSVDIVDRIVTDFREGRQSVAEFWITLGGKFVHIRYFAVRDTQSKYLGTLEVTQDLTKVRALEGERRLLAYAPQPS
jgi:uncharacterized protein